MRDQLEKVREFVGTGGIFTMSPEDHVGLDERSMVLVRIEGGRWRHFPPEKWEEDSAVAGAEQLLQLTLVGLTQGAIYALIALGFVTIYNVTGIINFAQGQFAMLGAMLMVTLAPLGLPVPVAFGLAVAGVVLVGGGLERLAIHPARNW